VDFGVVRSTSGHAGSSTHLAGKVILVHCRQMNRFVYYPIIILIINITIIYSMMYIVLILIIVLYYVSDTLRVFGRFGRARLSSIPARKLRRLNLLPQEGIHIILHTNMIQH
jgi:hypothetical protein